MSNSDLFPKVSLTHLVLPGDLKNQCLVFYQHRISLNIVLCPSVSKWLELTKIQIPGPWGPAVLASLCWSPRVCIFINSPWWHWCTGVWRIWGSQGPLCMTAGSFHLPEGDCLGYTIYLCFILQSICDSQGSLGWLFKWSPWSNIVTFVAHFHFLMSTALVIGDPCLKALQLVGGGVRIQPWHPGFRIGSLSQCGMQL